MSRLTLVELSDLVYLDVDTLLGSLPGIETRLTIRRVDGLSLYQDDGSYAVTLRGPGFGGDSDRVKQRVTRHHEDLARMGHRGLR